MVFCWFFFKFCLKSAISGKKDEKKFIKLFKYRFNNNASVFYLKLSLIWDQTQLSSSIHFYHVQTHKIFLFTVFFRLRARGACEIEKQHWQFYPQISAPPLPVFFQWEHISDKKDEVHPLHHATDIACINDYNNLIQKLRKKMLQRISFDEKKYFFFFTKLVLDTSQLWEWATLFRVSGAEKRAGGRLLGGALNRKNTVLFSRVL